MKLFIAILSLLVLTSCQKNEEKPIDVSLTQNLASSPKWAVITEAYTSYLSDAKHDSEILSYGRIGDVIPVEGIKIEDSDTVWYRFEHGWLPQTSVTIYANRLQANSAAQN